MENSDVINFWKTYNRKLEDCLLLNRVNTEEITRMKIQSSIRSMRPFKAFAILTGIIWVGFVDLLIIKLFDNANLFFLISAAIQVLLTKLAIGIYVYQLILIRQTDRSGSVVETQRKLSALKSSTIWCARFSFLQLPVWTTFYLNSGMLINGNVWLYAIQLLVSGLEN